MDFFGIYGHDTNGKAIDGTRHISSNCFEPSFRCREKKGICMHVDLNYDAIRTVQSYVNTISISDFRKYLRINSENMGNSCARRSEPTSISTVSRTGRKTVSTCPSRGNHG